MGETATVRMMSPATRNSRLLGAIIRSMPEKERKIWYQKGTVQAAFVAGAVAIGSAFLRPSPTPSPPPQVVVVQVPSATASVPVPTSRSVTQDDPTGVTSGPLKRNSPDEGKRPARPASGAPSAEPSASTVSTALDVPKKLTPDQPWFLSSLATAITATFRETLGSRYVEITIAAPGATTRFPARSAGASGRFSVGASLYEVQVLSINWESSVNVVVRAIPGP